MSHKKQIQLIFIMTKNKFNILSLDDIKEISIVTAYIQSNHLLKGTFLETIDQAYELAFAFIEIYPSNTNWELKSSNWEETIELFVINLTH